MMLTTVGRGGDGQRIRDEILHIMHRNNIKEMKGIWMEVGGRILSSLCRASKALPVPKSDIFCCVINSLQNQPAVLFHIHIPSMPHRPPTHLSPPLALIPPPGMAPEASQQHDPRRCPHL